MTPRPQTLDPVLMILEARIGFIILFLLVWSIIGLIPWTVSAIFMATTLGVPTVEYLP